MSAGAQFGSAFSNAGSVFGAAGAPFAPILSGVGGLLGAVFGADEDPRVPNPLPWASNPYEAQGILWGLPLHADDLNGWANLLPTHSPTTWAPTTPGGPPGAAAWLEEYALRGGMKGFDLSPLSRTRILHHHTSGQATTPPSVGGQSWGRFTDVAARGDFGQRPWGDWGDELAHPEWINARINRVLAQWEAVNDPDFEPVFWDIDYRTWPQKLRAIFAEQPLNIVNWWLFQARQQALLSGTLPPSQVSGLVPIEADIDLAAELWYFNVGGLEGHWTEWHAINQAMPALHLERTQEWLAWRAQLALEAQLEQNIQAAQDAAAAAVIEQYQNAVNPATDPTPPSIPAPSSTAPATFSSTIETPATVGNFGFVPEALISSAVGGPVGLGAGSSGAEHEPQQQGNGPAPLVLGGLAALALLLA